MAKNFIDVISKMPLSEIVAPDRCRGHIIKHVPEQSAAAMMDGLITTLNH